MGISSQSFTTTTTTLFTNQPHSLPTTLISNLYTSSSLLNQPINNPSTTLQNVYPVYHPRSLHFRRYDRGCSHQLQRLPALGCLWRRQHRSLLQRRDGPGGHQP